MTQEELQSILEYNKDTGLFVWKTNSDYNKTWNDANKRAGKLNNGYIQIPIKGKSYYAHRLAWLYIYGSWPQNQIDHVNCDRSDNRLFNLRESTQAENMRNLRKRTCSASGYKGVTLHKQTGKWQAHTIHNGKYKYLGLFADPQLAHLAYCEYASLNYGEFARAA